MILQGDAIESIAAAADCIRAGDLLGFPTETVYGLAADADSDAAVTKIFKSKGRPADHPLIVHVQGISAVSHYALDVPAFANTLMAAFWPGPLTLILPRRPGVATVAAGGNPSIGLRCPSHPLAQALLNALVNGCHHGNPSEAIHGPLTDEESDLSIIANKARQSMALPVWGLAAPSANQFGRVSPTTATHVQTEFGDALLILDGGPCSVGIESTIIDCTRGQPVLLRPGAITAHQVEVACGMKVVPQQELLTIAAAAPKTSGTLESHYAPRARVRLMAAAELQAALVVLQTNSAVPAAGVNALSKQEVAVWSQYQPTAHWAGGVWRAMPFDAASAAQQLFATLRGLDEQGVSQIWVEAPPDTPAWDGVRDRLQRAAH